MLCLDSGSVTGNLAAWNTRVLRPQEYLLDSIDFRLVDHSAHYAHEEDLALCLSKSCSKWAILDLNIDRLLVHEASGLKGPCGNSASLSSGFPGRA